MLCDALGVSKSTYYRYIKITVKRAPKPYSNRGSQRALSPVQRQEILDHLRSDRFVDMPPNEVYATLLDEGICLCSVRTMYRILKSENEVRERRNLVRHVKYAKPELLATAPNQVWSWDITKLKGPIKWTYYYLYVAMDIYSRRVVGWMVAHGESAALAKKLFRETCKRQLVKKQQLTIHSDRGTSMNSSTVGLLYSSLGITKSLSRPSVSNDNPFSESLFKTVKYRPEFPKRFGSLEQARTFCQRFFNWYNYEHYHMSLGLLTPDVVHSGQGEARNNARQTVLDRLFAEHPERFVRGRPKVLPLPTEVWINKPAIDPERPKIRNKDEVAPF